MRLVYINKKDGKEFHGYFSCIFKEKKRKIFGNITIYKDIYEWDGFKTKRSQFPIERTVRLDENNIPFFTYDGNRYNFTDYIVDSPEKFCKNITNPSYDYSDSDLSAILYKYGMDSIRVMYHTKRCSFTSFMGMAVRLTTSSSMDDKKDFKWIEYKFVLTHFLDNPLENHKLRLIPVNEEEAAIYPSIHTYTCDLISLFEKCTDTYRLKANV